jgi:mono/diheme cytochrome c family protein
MSKVVYTVLGLLVAGIVAAGLFIATGSYDVAANVQHTQPVHALLELTMHRSVKRRAAGINAPATLADAGVVERGAGCFRMHCVQCHGGPGVAQMAIGRSMQPIPGPLVDAAARWSAAELYWITRNGIKMSGMPAWQHRLRDGDIWALVAFMQRLPTLDVAAFDALAGPAARGGDCSDSGSEPARIAAPDPDRGRNTLTQYACNACHRIPGVTGSDVHVGPPLEGIGSRGLIAGRLPNTPDQMVRWLREPQVVDPGTAMPNMQLTEPDARDIAAYLATLR